MYRLDNIGSLGAALQEAQCRYEDHRLGQGYASIQGVPLTTGRTPFGATQLSPINSALNSYGRRPGAIVLASASTPTTTKHGGMLMSIFKKWFCKKGPSCEYDYVVTKHKTSQGCEYFRVKACIEGKWMKPWYFRSNGTYDPERTPYWYNHTPFSEGSHEVKFDSATLAKKIAVDYIRERRNLNFTEIADAGRIDA